MTNGNGSAGGATSSSNVLTLDPYRCIPKKNQKYASECTEAYLSDIGATSISDNFNRFENIEVVWFNGNRLSRLENLETNFRIREVYVQNNTLVSLAGLKSLKFLRVLLASDNQLRNLDKQLSLLSRFAFLNKLDLFGNPVSEEPDYRLRLIFHIPQVEILDRHTVKVPERIKADEVVPNLDKVSAAKMDKSVRKAQELSSLEKDCFRMAKTIRDRKRREDDERFDIAFSASNALTQISSDTKAPLPKVFQANRDHWANSTNLMLHDMTHPTPWELNDLLHFSSIDSARGSPGDKGVAGKDAGAKGGKAPAGGASPGQSGGVKELGLRSYIQNLAGKDELNKAEVSTLAEKLATRDDGGFGRILGNPSVFRSLPTVDGRSHRGALERSSKRAVSAPGGDRSREKDDKHGVASNFPLAKLLDNPESTIPTKEVTEYLLSLEWPRPDNASLDKRIDKLYEDARRAEMSGDTKTVFACKNSALRLEGAKSKKVDVGIAVKEDSRSSRKTRTDFFKQTFLRPVREVDDVTGRLMVKVSADNQTTRLGSQSR